MYVYYINIITLIIMIIIDVNHYFSTFLYLKFFKGFVIYHDFILVLLIIMNNVQFLYYIYFII